MKKLLAAQLPDAEDTESVHCPFVLGHHHSKVKFHLVQLTGKTARETDSQGSAKKTAEICFVGSIYLPNLPSRNCPNSLLRSTRIITRYLEKRRAKLDKIRGQANKLTKLQPQYKNTK